jgi:hypothetical protein
LVVVAVVVATLVVYPMAARRSPQLPSSMASFNSARAADLSHTRGRSCANNLIAGPPISPVLATTNGANGSKAGQYFATFSLSRVSMGV